MPKVEIDTPAPDFTLEDYLGNQIRLKDFRGKIAILVFKNR